MPRSYRGIILALGLGITLFAVGAATEHAAIWADGPSTYPEYYETAAQTQERFPALSTQEAIERAVKQQPCRNQQSREASDLCAQWRAADAAQRAAQWAWWQLILSAFGVVGLGVTLWFNLEAWKQAKDAQADTEKALSHAERSAAAMGRVADAMAINAEQIVRSVEISGEVARQQRLLGRMQMRAYLTVLIGDGVYQDDRMNFAAHPQILNSGHTPARNVRWKIAVDILPVPLPQGYKFRLPDDRHGGTIIGPGQNAFMSAIYNIRIAEDQVIRVKAGDRDALYVWGFLAYEDIFGKTHRTTFAQQIYWHQSGPLREDGIVPEGVRGFYLPRHNRAS